MEKIFFEEINGKKIFCHLSEPNPTTKRMVIMSHGFRGTSVGPARQFVDFQRLLNKENFSVLRFDQPNSGNSEGDYLETSYKEWVQIIVYLAKKYLRQGYSVALLGQSMGAAATVIATNDADLKGKIPCILLWVPGVNEGDSEGRYDEVFEEDGQKYKGKFWIEAKEANFFQCLQNYSGGIHLVYGEKDRYIRQELIDNVIDIVKEKNQPVMILQGEDHSPWKYDNAQKVFKEEITKLTLYV